MIETMRQHRWLFILRGIAAIVFGVLALLFPGITITTLVLFFGAYALIDGAAAIFTALRTRSTNDRWWVLMLEGLVGIAAGVIVFAAPAVATITVTLFVLYMIAIWAVATGVLEIITAFRLRREIEGEFWLGLAGVLSIVFGVALALFPGAGILSLLWLLAIYAIIFGIALIMVAIRIGGPTDRVPTSSGPVNV